jgi:hypothetical protein
VLVDLTGTAFAKLNHADALDANLRVWRDGRVTADDTIERPRACARAEASPAATSPPGGAERRRPLGAVAATL